MIKDPGSGNKPGARDVCGARGGEAELTFYTKSVLAAVLPMHTQMMKLKCV